MKPTMKLSDTCFALLDSQVFVLDAMTTKKLTNAKKRQILLDGVPLRTGTFAKVDVDGKDYDCDVRTGQLYKGGTCVTSERLTCE